MQHIDEYTIELYVLGSELVKKRREEIEQHFAECHGCRTVAAEMEAFYLRAEEGLEQKPQPEKDMSKALMRKPQNIAPYYEPGFPSVAYRPTTLIGRMGYFVRRHPVVMAAGGFGLAAALVVLGMMISNPFKQSQGDTIIDHNPAITNYNTTTEMLEVLNTEHQLLWQRKCPKIGIDRENEDKNAINETIIADLNDDGTNEVITSLNLIGYQTGIDDRLVLTFDSRGKLLWRKKIIETVHYIDRVYSPYFNVYALLINEDITSHQKDIILSVNHTDRSPSIIYRLDNNGNIIGKYWHFGNILGLYQRDLNGDGKQEIIICGRNDVDDTIHEEFSSITVLDPLRIIGDRRSTTCPGYNLPPSDAELYYLKIPRVDLDRINHTCGGISKMVVSDSSRLKFLLSNFDNWTFDLFLDHNMRVLEAKSYDHTDSFHKRLEEQGKLYGTIDKVYLENLKNSVRYWDGKKWGSSVAMVNRLPM